MISTKPTVTLADIPTGSKCVIIKVHGHGGFRHRILELGFVKGETITVLKNAPLLDPIEYEIMGSHVSLRRSEAHNIEVLSMDAEAHPDNLYHGVLEEHVHHEADELSHDITVALVGNPNCGKTSFFNFATGLHEKVGNYSGVTVDSKEGIFHHGPYTIHLIDLPGTYSLTEYSPDELYVRDYLDNENVDIVLDIVNAGALERNLFLTTQLIDRNHHMVLALNMYDELQKSGDTLDHEALGTLLGMPVVPVIARTGWGLDNVLEAIVQVYEDHFEHTKHIHINYGKDMEEAIAEIKSLILLNDTELTVKFPPRYVALKLIEHDRTTGDAIKVLPNGEEILKVAEQYRKDFEQKEDEDISSIISDLKYGFIRGALSETLTPSKKERDQALGYAVDKILTNKWLGFPILFLFLFLMFEVTFVIGAYPQDWIEMGMASLGEWLRNIMNPGMLTDLLVDGIIAGVGAVLVFVPQIMILFFFIALMEDSGYMARAAFITDKLMHRMGLHGKSFIPYIIGFGCSVPAVLAARTLENPRDRILTIVTVPFISCSARLPVYIMLVDIFFERHKALVLLSIYLIGLVVAIITSLLLSKTTFKKQDNPFVMELPPYRLPTFRNAMIHMWDKAKEWLKRVSTIVLLVSIVIWALGYFPHHEEVTASEQLEMSYLGQAGHAIEPVFRPMGLEWKSGVSLIAGAAAKEVIASCMAELNPEGIEASIPSALAAFAMMIFILLYCPCFSTLATIRQEIGDKWMWFSLLYSTTIAWVLATLIYQLGSLIPL